MKNKFHITFESGKSLTVEVSGASIFGVEVSRMVNDQVDKAIDIRRINDRRTLQE